jgi:hypothetical protein
MIIQLASATPCYTLPLDARFYRTIVRMPHHTLAPLTSANQKATVPQCRGLPCTSLLRLEVSISHIEEVHSPNMREQR